MATHAATKPVRRPRIVIAASEYARLTTLAEQAARRDSEVGEYLSEELSRAHIVPDEDCSPQLVRMGSRVTYLDEVTQRRREVTLVYPDAADMNRSRVSVLTPVGAALIGLSPSQSIEWPGPEGQTGVLTVLDVHMDNDDAGT